MSTEAPTEELQLAPEQPGEPPLKQLAPYDEFKTQIERLKVTAETITVADISQTAEMKIARTTRLALKDIRIAITHRHKELKENILVEGRKIDAGKNELLAVLEPLELRLKDQEEFIERETARIQAEKREARMAEITPFLTAPLAVDLGVVSDSDYAGMLADAKDAHAAKLAREQKEKEEAAAKAKEEAEERARVIAENIRLKEENAKKEAEAMAERVKAESDRKAAESAAQKEREAAEAERARLAKQVEDERKAAEAKAAKIKADADAAAAKERARVAAEQEAERQRVAHERHTAELKARKEREAIEAKARADREAAEAKARKEREAREKIEAEIAAIRAAESKLHAENSAREKAAALAPKKEKFEAFAKEVCRLSIPLLAEFGNSTEKIKKFSAGVAQFAKWIEKTADELDGDNPLTPRKEAQQ